MGGLFLPVSPAAATAAAGLLLGQHEFLFQNGDVSGRIPRLNLSGGDGRALCGGEGGHAFLIGGNPGNAAVGGIGLHAGKGVFGKDGVIGIRAFHRRSRQPRRGGIVQHEVIGGGHADHVPQTVQNGEADIGHALIPGGVGIAGENDEAFVVNHHGVNIALVPLGNAGQGEHRLHAGPLAGLIVRCVHGNFNFRLAGLRRGGKGNFVHPDVEIIVLQIGGLHAFRRLVSRQHLIALGVILVRIGQEFEIPGGFLGEIRREKHLIDFFPQVNRRVLPGQGQNVLQIAPHQLAVF
ncbi:MAG: hypothetical protein PUI95_00535 [Eubacteriales bacterium]|nr:hypothetical protein [Eubacteriales bacterium]